MNKRSLAKHLIAKPFSKLFANASRLSTLVQGELNPVYRLTLSNGKGIKFSCPNPTTLWRAQTLLNKEPDTIEWIDSFKESDILYDVGANVGCYSLYAALKKKCRVYAFEPESLNYGVLNWNIHLNEIDDRVQAYNIAVSSQAELGELNLKIFDYGGALHNFGEAVDYKQEQFSPSFRQGVLALSLDYMILELKLPIPDHIKIDVDGLEKQIFQGASELLKNKKIKSVLIELNEALKGDMELIEQFKKLGFKLFKDVHTAVVDKSQFSSMHNYIFKRY